MALRKPIRSCGNLGDTRLRRRRSENPMHAFDTLPPPLRRWLSQAMMPWSPASCRRIWLRAQARGEDVDTVLARLDQAEQRTLSRDHEFVSFTDTA